jgi:hypothetical protein
MKLLLRALPYMAALAVIFAGLWAVYSFGVHVEHQRRVAEVTAMDAKHTKALADISTANSLALAAMQTKAREAEQLAAERMAALDEKYTKEMQDAKRKADADIAAVRRGAVRVRDKFTCPGAGSPAGGVPQAGRSAGVGDAATGRGLGAEDAAEIIAAADTGDRWARQLMACQAIVRSDRATK